MLGEAMPSTGQGQQASPEQTVNSSITSAVIELLMASNAIDSAFATGHPVRKQRFMRGKQYLKNALSSLSKARGIVRPLRVAAADGASWTGLFGYNGPDFIREAQKRLLLSEGPVPMTAAYHRQQGDESLLGHILELADAANDAVTRLQSGVQREFEHMTTATDPWNQPEQGYIPLPVLVMQAATTMQNLHLYWSTAILLRTEFLRRDNNLPSLLEQVTP